MLWFSEGVVSNGTRSNIARPAERVKGQNIVKIPSGRMVAHLAAL